jgi:hypothetical protein
VDNHQIEPHPPTHLGSATAPDAAALYDYFHGSIGPPGSHRRLRWSPLRRVRPSRLPLLRLAWFSKEQRHVLGESGQQGGKFTSPSRVNVEVDARIDAADRQGEEVL